MNCKPQPRRIAVIGAGIAGLAAAHRLMALDPSCSMTLFEASDRLGGVISTINRRGFQVERSSDNFITTIPWGLNLCKRLGLAEQLILTAKAEALGKLGEDQAAEALAERVLHEWGLQT